MKILTGSLMLLAATGCFAEATADFGGGVPLFSACANALTQVYNSSTSENINQIVIKGYGDGVCGVEESTTGFGGTSIPVANSSSSFNMCLDYSTGALGLQLCTLANVTDGTGSIRITRVDLNTTGTINQDGNCIQITCTAGRATDWSIQSTAVLNFSQ